MISEILLIGLGFGMYYVNHHEATQRKIVALYRECKTAAKTRWAKHKAEQATREAQEAMKNG